MYNIVCMNKLAWLNEKEIETLSCSNYKVIQIIDKEERSVGIGRMDGPFGNVIHDKQIYYLCLLEKIL